MVQRFKAGKEAIQNFEPLQTRSLLVSRPTEKMVVSELSRISITGQTHRSAPTIHSP